MSAGCINSTGCIDAPVPVRATYANLFKWPESDAEFVKSVANGGKGVHNLSHGGSGRRRWSQSTRVVDSYSCRQMYLRSYTFSKKQTIPEKTMKCFSMVKEKASLFSKDSNASVASYGSSRSCKNTKKKKEKKKMKKGGVATKLKDASCSALHSLFHGLLSCTISVEVLDTHHSSERHHN